MQTTPTLAGKSAVVTGGSSGLGRQIALEYGERGANVVIGSIDALGNKRVVDEIEDGGGRAIAVKCDVRSDDDVNALVESCVRIFGGLDTLVAAAGIDPRTSPSRNDRTIVNLDLVTWDVVHDVNLKGTVRCLRAAIPAMTARGGGSIVTLTSGTVGKPNQGLAAYATSKAAIEMLTRVAALEVEQFAIRVNSLQPGGATNTAFFPEWTTDEERAAMHEPAVIRACAAYLAGDESAGITGESLVATEWNREHGIRLCSCRACTSTAF
jgi:NAD(P)-dependent dehydrogenase (short-subunit alcohol dehydrogenase family)